MEGQGSEGGATQTRQAPPGWYANPQGPGQRYWDGARWTDSYSQGATDTPPAKRRGCGGTVLKVALGIVLGVTLLIVGCVAILGAGVDSATKDQNKHAITGQQFRGVPQGSTEDQVKGQLGVAPGDAQEFESKGLPGSAVKSSCIYYNEKDKQLGQGRYFQFCFDNGKLTSKNSY